MLHASSAYVQELASSRLGASTYYRSPCIDAKNLSRACVLAPHPLTPRTARLQINGQRFARDLRRSHTNFPMLMGFLDPRVAEFLFLEHCAPYVSSHLDQPSIASLVINIRGHVGAVLREENPT